ncbi:MAG: tetratricopeptide repeat protein [Planctomycetota bacterium]
MRRTLQTWMCALLVACAAVAQDSMPNEVGNGGNAVQKTIPKIVMSDAARAALAKAREVAVVVRGLSGDEQLAALQAAAQAYDRTAGEFANEPVAAAQAAYTAGELWRRHGNVGEAERCYLQAATLDADRYAQRGQLAAADMQRRAERFEVALQTYRAAAAVDPTTARAQTARIWQARVLQSMGREVDAMVAFRQALASAITPRQVLDASNYLARALIDGGDLAAAEQVLKQADSAIATAVVETPDDAERLHKASESMSARKALQRARDKEGKTARDAQDVEAAKNGG